MTNQSPIKKLFVFFQSLRFNCNHKDEKFRLKIIDIFNEQVKDLIKFVAAFKVANATIHFDETSPHEN